MRAAQHFGVTSFHPDSIDPIPVTSERVHVGTRVAVCLHLCLHTPGHVFAASTATDIRFPVTHTTYVHDVLPLPTNYSVISMISSLSLSLFFSLFDIIFSLLFLKLSDYSFARNFSFELC